MWKLTTPWYDPVLRGLIIYLFVFLLVRFSGKKQLAKFTPFDFVLLVIASGIVSDAIHFGIRSNDYSITGSLIVVAVIIALNLIMNELIVRVSWFEKFVNGQPVVIILNGKMFKKVMRQQRITEAELFLALREHEVMNPGDVKCAILEKDGHISVIKYEH